MEREDYDNRQRKRMRRYRKDYGVCFLCGEDDPKIMKYAEKHHLHGKVNDDETILLCPNCHKACTEEQNKLPPMIRSGRTSKDKIIFCMRSHGAVLEKIAKKQIELSEELEGLA